MIKISINVKAISGNGKKGYNAQAMLGCVMVTAVSDASGKTSQEVADDCIEACKQYLPDADYKINLPNE